MLLRSITKHVRDQNWFAVALDFFIVVVGILIALQITNWNDAGKERALEAVYTERLRREVMDLESVRERMVTERARASVVLQDATAKLMNPDGGSLTKAECFWLAYNPPTSNPSDDLPLIIELLSSGRFAIFTNKDIEGALGNYLITRTRARDSRLGVVADIPDLDGKYPQFHAIGSSITVSSIADVAITDESLTSFPVTCDEDGMRANQAYLNGLAHLQAEFYFHARDNRNVSRALAELHSVLDEILAVDHEEAQ